MNNEEQKGSQSLAVEKSKNFKSLESYFKISGVVLLFFGLIHIWSIISEGFSPILLGDATINTLFGILLLFCARLLSKRMQLVIWIFAPTIIISVIYSFAVGRGFNYIYAILGGVIFFMLVNLKKNNELA